MLVRQIVITVRVACSCKYSCCFFFGSTTLAEGYAYRVLLRFISWVDGATLKITGKSQSAMPVLLKVLLVNPGSFFFTLYPS